MFFMFGHAVGGGSSNGDTTKTDQAQRQFLEVQTEAESDLLGILFTY
jgi:hypothetical protein